MSEGKNKIHLRSPMPKETFVAKLAVIPPYMLSIASSRNPHTAVVYSLEASFASRMRESP
jgi:hypothetical protein